MKFSFHRKLATVSVAVAALMMMASGCGTIGGIGFLKKNVSDGAVSTVRDLVATALKHDDVVILQTLMEADLLLLETLCEESPDNSDLLALTSKFYAYYAFGFVVHDDLERARKLYWRGIDFGMRALQTNKKFKQALDDGVNFVDAMKYLDEDDEDDVQAAYVTALNMGLLLICSLEVPKVLALTTKFVELDLWVMNIDETYEYGSTHTLIGVYYGIMPAFGGGGPEKCRREFERAIELNPNWLLHSYFYARYYPTLIVDEEHFDRLLDYVLKTPSDSFPETRALNEVAKIKAKLLLQKRDLYF